MFFYESQKNIYAHAEIATTCIVVAKEDMVKDGYFYYNKVAKWNICIIDVTLAFSHMLNMGNSRMVFVWYNLICGSPSICSVEKNTSTIPPSLLLQGRLLGLGNALPNSLVLIM
jgi:hypothetical protein